MANLLAVEQEILFALSNPEETLDSITAKFELKKPLLHEALVTHNECILAALEQSDRFNFDTRNAMGETIIHTISAMGDERCLARLKAWVERGLVNAKALTDIMQNFLHFIPHIEDASLLTTYFSMATVEQVTTGDQSGRTPLELAIEQDNHVFLEQVISQFPELIALERYGHGYRLHQQNLLHDIAKAGAIKCYGVLRAKFADDIWFELQNYRNSEEQLPIDAALLAEQTTLFQMFKGYLNSRGQPKLQWVATRALVSQQGEKDISAALNALPESLHEMHIDATQAIRFEAQKRKEREEIVIDDDDCILGDSNEAPFDRCFRKLSPN